MILEIEYYKGDMFLYGKNISKAKLNEQLMKTEKLYDKDSDNFITLFCRLYGWTVFSESCKPDFIYDRDTMKLI